MENTAPHRRDHRRAEYGDERIPEIREMLERISPVNHADKITKPMCIAHGENDTRVPLGEALRMWEIAKEHGIDSELIVCEGEGHGKSHLFMVVRGTSDPGSSYFICRVQAEKCN